MESIPPAAGPGAARHRRLLNRAVKESLRDLSAQLSLLNHSVGGRLDLKATDLERLDLITRYGPRAGSLARRFRSTSTRVTVQVPDPHRPGRTGPLPVDGREQAYPPGNCQLRQP